jgi:aryl-alcohol dehydrogenase-like predicted oxidoreductase
MRYVNLGATGLRVSRVCLEMMGFGNDSVPYPALGYA